MVKMNVTITSGLHTEGFDVQIFKNNEEIFSESYYRLKPYTSDILSELAKEYTVDYISVEGSISVFSGNPMPREKIESFIQTYIYPEASLYNLIKSEDNINK